MGKNKIDQKLKIELGGLRQKIHITSKDDSLPVLLFLHGGPGVVNRHGLTTAHTDLLDAFTLVGWDQRGSGGSYWGAKNETLTISRLTDDAAELVAWLCERFLKDKIFIIGGSWGSELGTHLVYHYPEKIAAYVGFGQVVNGEANETISYDFTLSAAKEAGNEKDIRLLESVGPPVKGHYKGGFNGMMTQRKLMTKYGGYSPSEKKRKLVRSFAKSMIFSKEYSLTDLIGTILGYQNVLKVMWGEIADTDLATKCPVFRLPYFIFDGRLDNNTPASLVEEYFEKIEAPQKELIWFENSGHNPMGDEPERFKTLLRKKLSEVAAAEREKGINV